MDVAVVPLVVRQTDVIRNQRRKRNEIDDKNAESVHVVPCELYMRKKIIDEKRR